MGNGEEGKGEIIEPGAAKGPQGSRGRLARPCGLDTGRQAASGTRSIGCAGLNKGPISFFPLLHLPPPAQAQAHAPPAHAPAQPPPPPPPPPLPEDPALALNTPAGARRRRAR